MQEETTYYGDFGEDSDDMQEQEVAQLAGKDKVVSGATHVHNLCNSLLTSIRRTSSG